MGQIFPLSSTVDHTHTAKLTIPSSQIEKELHPWFGPVQWTKDRRRKKKRNRNNTITSSTTMSIGEDDGDEDESTNSGRLVDDDEEENESGVEDRSVPDSTQTYSDTDISYPTHTSSTVAQHSFTPSIYSAYSLCSKRLTHGSWEQKDFSVVLVNAKRVEDGIVGILTSGIYDFRVENESEVILNHVLVKLYTHKAPQKIHRIDIRIDQSKIKNIPLPDLIPKNLLGEGTGKDPLSILREWFGEDAMKMPTIRIEKILICTQSATPFQMRPDPSLETSMLGYFIVLADMKNVEGYVHVSSFYRSKIILKYLKILKSEFTSFNISAEMEIAWKKGRLKIPVLLFNLNHSIKRLRIDKPVVLPDSQDMKLEEVLEQFNLKHPTPSLMVQYPNTEESSVDRQSSSSSSSSDNRVILKEMRMTIGTKSGFYRHPSIQLDTLEIQCQNNHKFRPSIRINDQILLREVTTLHENMAMTTSYNPGVRMSIKGCMEGHPLNLVLQISTYKDDSKVDVSMCGHGTRFHPSRHLDQEGRWFHLFRFMGLEGEMSKSIPSFIADEILCVDIVSFSFVYHRKRASINDISFVLKFEPTRKSHRCLIPGLVTTRDCLEISYLLDSHRLRTHPGMEIRFKLYNKNVTLNPSKEFGVLEMKHDPRFLFNFGDRDKDYLFKLPLGSLIYEHDCVPTGKEETELMDRNVFLTQYSVNLVTLEVKVFGYMFFCVQDSRRGSISSNPLEGNHRSGHHHHSHHHSHHHHLHRPNIVIPSDETPVNVEMTFRCSPSGSHLRSSPSLIIGNRRVSIYFKMERIREHLIKDKIYVDCIILTK